MLKLPFEACSRILDRNSLADFTNFLHVACFIKIVVFYGSKISDESLYMPKGKFLKLRDVVVAQLVERSLSIPEVRGSTPVIGKILLSICLLSTVLKRRKKH